MSTGTSIEWTDATWNPLRARRIDTGKTGWHCEKISAGCANCYAETFNGRLLPGGGTGLRYARDQREKVEMHLNPDVLAQPLKWRKPRRVFVCSMTDLFGEWVSDEHIDRVFAVMALAPQHTFQVLTKRPERMREYMALDLAARAGGWCRHDKVRNRASDLARTRGKLEQLADNVDLNTWPLPNVWLGVSVEDQASADERIPMLLDTPAAVRFISAEPMVGPINLLRIPNDHGIGSVLDPAEIVGMVGNCIGVVPALDLVIVGGESGPGARPCDVAWIRSVVEQCRAADVACFVEQLGANPWKSGVGLLDDEGDGAIDHCPMRLHDRKGGDMAEWPEDLRVREFPPLVRA